MGSNFEFLPNYTGPYISNGLFQESVEFGDKPPKDKLDALSRLHDTAYARYDDYGHRRAADVIYEREARKLVGLFPELAGFVVKYGNQVGSSASNLLSGYSTFGPLGILVGGVKNALRLHDYMLNQSKYKNDITQLYATDPIDFRRGRIGDNGAAVNSNPLGKPPPQKTSTGESVRQNRPSGKGDDIGSYSKRGMNLPAPNSKTVGSESGNITNTTQYNPYLHNFRNFRVGRRRRNKKKKIYITYD